MYNATDNLVRHLKRHYITLNPSLNETDALISLIRSSYHFRWSIDDPQHFPLDHKFPLIEKYSPKYSKITRSDEIHLWYRPNLVFKVSIRFSSCALRESREKTATVEWVTPPRVPSGRLYLDISHEEATVSNRDSYFLYIQHLVNTLRAAN